MGYLDDRAANAVLLLSGIKGSRPSPYELYLQSCVQNNVSSDLGCSVRSPYALNQGGIIDEDEEVVKQRLSNIIRHISRKLSYS
jgi:sister-chromatid-cohesion protein PDS5